MKPKFLITSRVDGKDCAHCRYYHSIPLVSPGGWCNLYPSEKVNTDDFSVCYKFKLRFPFIRPCRYIKESWEEIINNINTGQINIYHIGDFKKIKLTDGIEIKMYICNINKNNLIFSSEDIKI